MKKKFLINILWGVGICFGLWFFNGENFFSNMKEVIYIELGMVAIGVVLSIYIFWAISKNMRGR